MISIFNKKKPNLCEKACESKCFLRTWLTAISDSQSYDVKPKPKYTSHSYESLATILIGDLRISWLNTKMRTTWKNKINWRTSWSLKNTKTIKRIIYITILASSAFDKEYGHGFFIYSFRLNYMTNSTNENYKWKTRWICIAQ